MSHFSPKLTALLLTRGVARFVAPVAICWGIVDAYYYHPLYALAYALLTFNYVLIYLLSWIAPQHINGPLRVRSWQTFVILINMVLLPILYYRNFGEFLWGFAAISVLFIAALIAGSAVVIYFSNHLPLASSFARSRGFAFETLQPGTDSAKK